MSDETNNAEIDSKTNDDATAESDNADENANSDAQQNDENWKSESKKTTTADRFKKILGEKNEAKNQVQQKDEEIAELKQTIESITQWKVDEALHSRDRELELTSFHAKWGDDALAKVHGKIESDPGKYWSLPFEDVLKTVDPQLFVTQSQTFETRGATGTVKADPKQLDNLSDDALKDLANQEYQESYAY